MNKEPAAVVGLIVGIVSAVLVFLKSFGVDISQDQQEAIRGLVAVIAPIVAGFVIRQFVFSPNSASNIAQNKRSAQL